MILLDTNVISETLRPAPDSRVVSWLDAQLLETLYLSSVTVAEMRYGIAGLPKGTRREKLSMALEKEILPRFYNRICPFDMTCTAAWAALMAKAKAAGLAIATADGMIAAIAMTNSFSVATRDVGPFHAAGVKVITPWEV